MVTFSVYILRSDKTHHYYIGSCESVYHRLAVHNAGSVRSTKAGNPWKLIYTEKFSSRSEAVQRERQIKSYKGGVLFKRLLGLWKDDLHGEVA